MLKSLLPNKVKVKNTIDDNRLKTNLTPNKTIRFTKRFFFNTILGYTQSHSSLFCDIDGYIWLTPGTHQNEKPPNITGNDKLHLKGDCINESILNGTREPILYSFVSDKLPRHKIYKEPRIKL